MGKWESKSVEEIAVYLSRGQSPAYVDEESGIWAINQKCVRDGRVDYRFARSHNANVPVKQSVILHDGDICINSTGTGTLGRVGVWKTPPSGVYFADSHVTILRPNSDKADPYCLAALAQSSEFQSQIETFCLSGSTNQVELNRTALATLSLDLPSLKEQQKISAILSRIDQVIELTEALIAKQQRLKTGLMKQLLTKGIDEHGKLRSEATHEFKDSPLGRIPAEWYVTSIGNQFTVRRDRGRTGLPIMSVVMNDGLVERSSIMRRVETALTPEQHALVCEGDIAYNMMRMWQGVLGRASCDCLVSPAYVVLKPLESINSRFAEWLFRDVRMVHAFRQASKGVVDDRLRLYPKDIFPITMAIPQCVEEQSQIADRLDAQLQAIASEIRALEKLRHVRVGLMQDLLTGKVLVTSLLETKLRTT